MFSIMAHQCIATLTILIILTCAPICHACNQQVPDDLTIQDVLGLPANPDPAWIEHIDQLIFDNPEHPLIHELRMHRTQCFSGLSMERSHKLEVIEELRSISEAAGPDSEIGYQAQQKIGQIYLHHLGNYKLAFQVWEALDGHPTLSVDRELTLEDRPPDDPAGIERDRRRITLYSNIVHAAFGELRLCEPEQEEYLRDAIGYYGQIVLAYPYFRGEELRTTHRHTLYRQFFECHRTVAGMYLSVFRDDYQMLSTIIVFPHHGDQSRRHRNLLSAFEVDPQPELAGASEHELQSQAIDPRDPISDANPAVAAAPVNAASALVRISETDTSLQSDSGGIGTDAVWLWRVLAGLGGVFAVAGVGLVLRRGRE